MWTTGYEHDGVPFDPDVQAEQRNELEELRALVVRVPDLDLDEVQRMRVLVIYLSREVETANKLIGRMIGDPEREEDRL
jgi:hypothetical protein